MIDRRELLRNAMLLATSTWLPGCISRRDRDVRPDDAVSMLAALAANQITPPFLIEQAIARLGRVNAALNAVVSTTYSRARTAAAEAPAGPCFGIPTVTKDNAPRAGEPYTRGSRAFHSMVADRNHPYVTALDRAGFLSIARTTCPEFGLAPTTEPLLTGPTRNPWDTDFSVGGSSGGSAALVAAGVVPVGHGNDGGGSLRIPASACGVIGFKTTRRPEGPEGGTSQSRSASGCLSRSVRDTALWMAHVSGLDPILPAPDVRFRIAACADPPGGGMLHDDVRRVHQSAVALLRDMGHRVIDVALPYDGAGFTQAFLNLYERGAMELVDRHRADAVPDESFDPVTLGLADAGRRLSADRIATARAIATGEADRYLAAFAGFDIYMTPVLAAPPAPIGRFAASIPYAEQRNGLIAYATYTFMQNAANAPAVSLPIGMSSTGLPIGLQFCAPAREEARLLALAYAIEASLSWHRRRPVISAD